MLRYPLCIHSLLFSFIERQLTEIIIFWLVTGGGKARTGTACALSLHQRGVESATHRFCADAGQHFILFFFTCQFLLVCCPLFFFCSSRSSSLTRSYYPLWLYVVTRVPERRPIRLAWSQTSARQGSLTCDEMTVLEKSQPHACVRVCVSKAHFSLSFRSQDDELRSGDKTYVCRGCSVCVFWVLGCFRECIDQNNQRRKERKMSV